MGDTMEETVGLPKDYEYYKKEDYPFFVVNHGNWDIYRDADGYCVAFPTKEAKAKGCKTSHFGDMEYTMKTLNLKKADFKYENQIRKK